MKRVLTLVVGLAIMTWAAQAALLTSPNGSTVDPSDFGSVLQSSGRFLVTVDGTPRDDLFEDVTYVQVNGTGYVLVDTTNFQFEWSDWADPYGPGTGYSEVSNVDTFGGTVNPGDIRIGFYWSIEDMTGPEGGARYVKEVVLANDSGSDITASIVDFVDLDILDSSGDNMDVGCYFSTWGAGTALMQNDPTTSNTDDFRGYFFLNRGLQADGWDVQGLGTVVGDITVVGALANLTADGSAWWNGGGAGSGDLGMALGRDLGTIPDGFVRSAEFVVSVPEPTTYALVGLGLAAIAAYRRRKS